MKKVLLATTILAASAGFAAADVTVTGTARMGVAYDDSKADNELSFTNRVRIIFTASGETDGGLSFGASVRADNSDEANDTGSTGTVFISGAFGTITMGDVSDAFGALYGDIAGVGLTGLGDLNELSSSADGGAFSVGDNSFLTGTVFNPFAAELTEGEEGDQAPIYNSLFSLNENGRWTVPVSTLVGVGSTLAFQFGDQFDAAAAQEAYLDEAGLPSDFDLADLDDVLVEDGILTVGIEGDGGSWDLTRARAARAFENAVIAGFGLDPAELNETFAWTGDCGDNPESLSCFENGELAWNITGTYNLAAIDARALYVYSMDGFSVALGYSQTGKAEAGSIAASYTVDNLTISAGYASAKWDDAAVFALTATGESPDNGTLADGQSTNFVTETLATFTHDAKAEDWSLGVRYAIDSVTLAAVYQDRTFKLNGIEVDNQKTAGVSVGYTMDALSLTAFAKQTDSSAFAQKSRAYGIGAAYDLGGGASVVGGIVDSRGFTGSSKTTADLGVSFTF